MAEDQGWSFADEKKPKADGWSFADEQPPPYANPRPPRGLMSSQEKQSAPNAPTFQNPRTGRISVRTDPGESGNPLGAVLDSPITGTRKAIGGMEHMAQPGMKAKAEGLGDVIGGVAEAATPAMVASGLYAPAKTAAALGGGWLSQQTAEGVSNAVGIPPEYSRLIGDAASIPGAVGGARFGGSPRLGGAIKAGVKAGGRDVGLGAAQVGGEFAAAQVLPDALPGGAPVKIAAHMLMGYPYWRGMRQIGSGLKKGVEAGKEAWSPTKEWVPPRDPTYDIGGTPSANPPFDYPPTGTQALPPPVARRPSYQGQPTGREPGVSASPVSTTPAPLAPYDYPPTGTQAPNSQLPPPIPRIEPESRSPVGNPPGQYTPSLPVGVTATPAPMPPEVTQGGFMPRGNAGYGQPSAPLPKAPRTASAPASPVSQLPPEIAPPQAQAPPPALPVTVQATGRPTTPFKPQGAAPVNPRAEAFDTAVATSKHLHSIGFTAEQMAAMQPAEFSMNPAEFTETLNQLRRLEAARGLSMGINQIQGRPTFDPVTRQVIRQ